MMPVILLTPGEWLLSVIFYWAVRIGGPIALMYWTLAGAPWFIVVVTILMIGRWAYRIHRFCSWLLWDWRHR